MMTNELRKKIDNMTVSERESFIEGLRREDNERRLYHI